MLDLDCKLTKAAGDELDNGRECTAMAGELIGSRRRVDDVSPDKSR